MLANWLVLIKSKFPFISFENDDLFFSSVLAQDIEEMILNNSVIFKHVPFPIFKVSSGRWAFGSCYIIYKQVGATKFPIAFLTRKEYSRIKEKSFLRLMNKYNQLKFKEDNENTTKTPSNGKTFFVGRNSPINRMTLPDIDFDTPPPAPKQLDTKRINYKDLSKSLKSIILGQDTSIDDIVKKLMRKDLNLSCDKKKPLSMFWAGPTGVGKTELALQLGKHIKYPIVRIDMSEYMKEHEVAKLIGAPPGYAGFSQPTPLEECNGQRCVIIFDEIEKAHPNVMNIFLQILDYGVLTNGQGKQIDLTQSIIIMTSNVGAMEMNERKIGLAQESLESKKTTIHKAMSDTFRPEFINRLSSIQVFNSLSEEIMSNLIETRLKTISEALESQYETQITISHNLLKELKEESFDPNMGARPMERAFEKLILEPLSEYILSEGEGNLILDYRNNKTVIFNNNLTTGSV